MKKSTKTGRELFMPKFKELPTPCVSCPFRVGNAKEWAAKMKQLADASPFKVDPVPPVVSRFRIHDEVAQRGDFLCHNTVYDSEMQLREKADYRQCPGATKFFKTGKTS